MITPTPDFYALMLDQPALFGLYWHITPSGRKRLICAPAQTRAVSITPIADALGLPPDEAGAMMDSFLDRRYLVTHGWVTKDLGDTYQSPVIKGVESLLGEAAKTPSTHEVFACLGGKAELLVRTADFPLDANTIGQAWTYLRQLHTTPEAFGFSWHHTTRGRRLNGDPANAKFFAHTYVYSQVEATNLDEDTCKKFMDAVWQNLEILDLVPSKNKRHNLYYGPIERGNA